MTCTRCEGTGFLNFEQLPEHVRERDNKGILRWMYTTDEDHDVKVCDCCGDGADWYGEPGQHYTAQDPRGAAGPYAYNGGLAECN